MTADEILSMTVAELVEQEDMWFYLLSRIRIEDRGHTTPCWVMIGNADSIYSDLPNTRRRYGARAHQAAYHIWVNPRADGHSIHHLCEVTNCINPDHLQELTLSEHSKIRK